MPIFAVIKNDVVVALIKATNEFATANIWELKGIVRAANGVRIGDYYFDGEFFRPLSDGLFCRSEFLALFTVAERKQIYSLKDRHVILQDLIDFIDSKEGKCKTCPLYLFVQQSCINK
jgi:hypothetical protein